MADLVLLTPRTPVSDAVPLVLPGLALLPHVLESHALDVGVLLRRPAEPDLVLVDLVSDLMAGHGALRSLEQLELGCPVLAVLGESALGIVEASWPADDVVATDAGPAEVGARVRLLLQRGPRRPAPPAVALPTSDPGTDAATLQVADVVVDEASWTVRAGGQPLDLTFKEFELLRYLVQHPGRVVTRDLLLQEVWGMDYYGGTRTVDVHVRRLRAKLGPERESLIGTIRGVGYRFSGPRGER
ncbi:winged helix-turn-helix transcriptional regulator [Ornithinimicrobium tianjinense]|uniref:winged helix-turn-helix transcriptional regulator n=1 Tax=Ornithinimicrobium tianjinense TaxID=1195761 RepID=UPI001E498ADE|nr:response regulator transcription factor [Ornithinimicrobium tianjinense]